MNEHSILKEHLNALKGSSIAVYQGIVNSVDGTVCEVQIGNIAIPDVRLRASEIDLDGEMLITPKVGSAVIVGSLSGDLTQLVVLQVDKVESIVVNGGKLGGLVNIDALTSKLNELVQAFNSHVHPCPNGMTSKSTTIAQKFDKGDYEDDKIKH